MRFRVGKLRVQPGLDLLAQGFGVRLGGVARRLADRVGFRLCLGKLLLIGSDGRVGIALGTGSLVEVLRDTVAARLENMGDARQNHLLQEEIEQAERNRQPQ